MTGEMQIVKDEIYLRTLPEKREQWKAVDDVDQALIAEILIERYGYRMMNDRLLTDMQAYLVQHGYRMVDPQIRYSRICHLGIEKRVSDD